VKDRNRGQARPPRQSGHRVGTGWSYEVYRNTPMNTPPEQLHTDIYLPIE
jgi:AraC family transcriptional regulator